MRLHRLSQPGIQECARSPWLACLGGRLDLCRTGAIGGQRRVAGYLAAQRARRSTQDPGHHLQQMAGPAPDAQDFTIFSTHVSIGTCSHGNTLAQPDGSVALGVRRLMAGRLKK